MALRVESALLKAQLVELAGEESGDALSFQHLRLLPGELLLKHGRSLLMEAQSFSQSLLNDMALPQPRLIRLLPRWAGRQLIHATRKFLHGKAALVSLLLKKAHLLLFG